MKRQIIIRNERLEYFLKKNRLSKSLRLIMHSDGQLILTAPNRLGLGTIENFLKKQADWILQHLEQAKKKNGKNFLGKEDHLNYLAQKNWARKRIHFLVEKLAGENGFHYQKISIRNQKTRWGSCSKKGNLNFHYKTAFLPEKLAEYVIIHELCHLREFNHSLQFWSLVKDILPDYLERRKELRQLSRKNEI